MNWFMAALGRVSGQAALLVLLVIVAQRLFKSRLSPRWRCALWILPALRLLLPVSISSAVSLFNLAPSWEMSNATPRSAAAFLPGAAKDLRRSTSRNIVADLNELEIPRRLSESDERKFDPPSSALAEVNHGLSGNDLRAAAGDVSKSEITADSRPPGVDGLYSRSAPATPRHFDWPVALFTFWLIGFASLLIRILITCGELNRMLADAEEVR